MTEQGTLSQDDFLLYEIISQMRSRLEKQLPKTEFYKIAYVSDRELRELDIDVGLPTHWYQFGPELYRQEPVIYEFESAEDWDGDRTILREGVSEDSFQHLNGDRDRIREVARQEVSRFRDTYSTTESKNYAYDRYAPTEFINVFDEFRQQINTYAGSDSESLSNFGSGRERSEILSERLHDLVRTYPTDKYTGMHDAFLQWESISQQLARLGDFESIKTLSEDFWLSFSRAELRLHHNNHIPPEEKARWIIERDRHIAHVGRILRDFREFVIETREPTNVLDTVAEEYSQVVREFADELDASAMNARHE